MSTKAPANTPTVPKARSHPIQKKARIYYDQCSLNKEQGTCSFNFNHEVRMVPEQEISKVPLELLNPLTIRSDLEYMESFSIIGLARLQSQMAVGSSVVSKFIAHKLTNTGLLLDSKDTEIDKLEEEKLELKRQLALVANTLNQVKTKAAIDLAFANDEIEKKDQQIEKDMEELNGLRVDLASSQSLLESEKAYNKLRAEGFQKRILDLQVAAQDPKFSYEDAIQKFKESEEYMDLMIENGEFGFQLLKKFLIKDGHIDTGLLDFFDFSTCDQDAKTLQD